jgi:hypothetical protein
VGNLENAHKPVITTSSWMVGGKYVPKVFPCYELADAAELRKASKLSDQENEDR